MSKKKSAVKSADAAVGDASSAAQTASNVVEILRPSRKSYNPNRPLSNNTLLLNQVRHFQHLEKQMPPEHQTGQQPKTEGEAAEYLKKMTARLHPEGQAKNKVIKAPGL